MDRSKRRNSNSNNNRNFIVGKLKELPVVIDEIECENNPNIINMSTSKNDYKCQNNTIKEEYKLKEEFSEASSGGLNVGFQKNRSPESSKIVAQRMIVGNKKGIDPQLFFHGNLQKIEEKDSDSDSSNSCTCLFEN